VHPPDPTNSLKSQPPANESDGTRRAHSFLVSFKVCSNLGCPFCVHHGVPAQYLPVAEGCQYCGAGLLAIAGPSRDAATVVSATLRSPRIVRQEHALFLAGLFAVLVPHFLARAVGPLAYLLPVLAVAYVVTRAIGNMEPTWLAPRATRR